MENNDAKAIGLLRQVLECEHAGIERECFTMRIPVRLIVEIESLLHEAAKAARQGKGGGE
jgi:hypothetical protein